MVFPESILVYQQTQSQSLKSNPHTTENCLLRLLPLSLEKRKRSTPINLSEWQLVPPPSLARRDELRFSSCA